MYKVAKNNYARRKGKGNHRDKSHRLRARFDGDADAVRKKAKQKAHRPGAIVFGQINLAPHPSLLLAERGKKRFFSLTPEEADYGYARNSQGSGRWREGEVVRARLIQQAGGARVSRGGWHRRILLAKPLESLGYFDGDVGFLCSLSLRQHTRSDNYTTKPEVTASAENLKAYEFCKANISAHASRNSSEKIPREDLRAMPFVTIDGEDARDFDDAIHATPLANGGFRINVAIADVAFYVKQGAEIDLDARARGNSIYLPERAINMLPKRLSEELCSLKPLCEKPCLMVEIEIDKVGRIQKYRIARVVIKSIARVTYREVDNLLENKKSNNSKSKTSPTMHIDKCILNLYKAWGALALARAERGALHIERSEPYPKLQTHADGRISCIAIEEKSTSDAQRIVEDFMVAANATIAEFLNKTSSHKKVKSNAKGIAKSISFVARNHEPPQHDKWQALQQDIARLGLSSSLLACKNSSKTSSQKPNATQAKRSQLRALLASSYEQSENSTTTPALVVEAVLRAQSQARYTCENSEHFALALDNYCHFTSPIRRYADLLVHRAVLAAMDKAASGESAPDEAAPDESVASAELCEHLVECERSAIDVERAIFQRIACLHLQERILAKPQAAICDGIVVRVKPFGFFVRLLEFAIEGIVERSHSQSYRFEYGREQAIVDGQNIAFGSKVKVQIHESDPISGRLELRLQS